MRTDQDHDSVDPTSDDVGGLFDSLLDASGSDPADPASVLPLPAEHPPRPTRTASGKSESTLSKRKGGPGGAGSSQHLMKKAKAFEHATTGGGASAASKVTPWQPGNEASNLASLTTTLGLPSAHDDGDDDVVHTGEERRRRNPGPSDSGGGGSHGGGGFDLDLDGLPSLSGYSHSSIQALGLDSWNLQQPDVPVVVPVSPEPTRSTAAELAALNAVLSAASTLEPVLAPAPLAAQIDPSLGVGPSETSTAEEGRASLEGQVKQLFGAPAQGDGASKRRGGKGKEPDIELDYSTSGGSHYVDFSHLPLPAPTTTTVHHAPPPPLLPPRHTPNSNSTTTSALNPVLGITAREAAATFQGDEERPHHCPNPDCDKKFSRKSDFLRHFRIHTGERPFVCGVVDCGKSFIQRSALTVHSRVHSGDKPHACTECNRHFSDSSSLARHRRVHAGLKPFRCERCLVKSFSRKATLTRHQMICTGTGGGGVGGVGMGIASADAKAARLNRPSRSKGPKVHHSVRPPGGGSSDEDDDGSDDPPEEQNHHVEPDLVVDERNDLYDNGEEDLFVHSAAGPGASSSSSGSARRASASLRHTGLAPGSGSPVLQTSAELASAATSDTRTEVHPVPRPRAGLEGVAEDQQAAVHLLVSAFRSVEDEATPSNGLKT